MFSFFPQDSLLEAWEQSPLLSVASTSTYMGGGDGVHVVKQARNETHEQDINNVKFCDVIPVVRQKQDSDRKWKYQDLFSSNDFGTIFSEPGLVHKKDYTVGKKVIRDGEEWFGQIPLESIPVEQVNYAIFQKGFSLVFNNMEERWRPIRDVAFQILEEMSCRAVSCNLYLTPPASTNDENGESSSKMSGFEVHLDWMDVFVVQMIGTKLWSVGTTPLIEYATTDLKRRPTLKEISSTFAEQTYRDFLLMPGDILYIPRGFLHNASTVSEEFVQNHMVRTTIHDNVGETETCTKATKASDINAGRFAQQGSMHLTFGVEHLCDTTIESMVHVAVEYYWNERIHHTKEDDNDVTNEVCDSQIIHLVIAHLAHMYEKCSNGFSIRPHMTFHDDEETIRLARSNEYAPTTERVDLDASFCSLRQSIPAIRSKMHQNDKSSFREECKVDGTENCSTDVQSINDSLHGIFVRAMDAVATENAVQLQKTKRFYQANKDGKEMMAMESASEINFCYPSMPKPIGGTIWPPTSCGLEEALAVLSKATASKTTKKALEDRLKFHLVGIRDFAVEHYNDILDRWEKHVAHVRRGRQNAIDSHLNRLRR